MTSRSLLLVLASCVLASCTAFPDEGGDDGGDDGGDPPPVDQTCRDARYADGVCNLPLDCAVPDIDCFRTFERDADAATWFTGFEEVLASEAGRAPRAIVPEADPRFQKARALLDRGWEAFRRLRPVGRMARLRPALVLLDDPEINAFVAPDLDQQSLAFSVQVLTGALAAGADDDALLGLMMHELQHALGLHLIGDTRERLKAFYVARDGREPIGADQRDDAALRAIAEPWIAAATAVSYHSAAELGGLPLGGDLDQMLGAIVRLGKQVNPRGCQRSVDLLNAVRGELGAAVDPLDNALKIDLRPLAARIEATLRALRDECFAGLTESYAEVVAELTGQTAAQVEASLSPRDRMLVADKHVVDALAALASDRRATMRMAEAAFTAKTGQPWSALRYFSFEEDADDVSVEVLRGAQFDPAGGGEFLRLIIPEGARGRCDAKLAAGEVPAYGVDLTDQHHALCWRVDHVRTLADLPTRARHTPAASTTTLERRGDLPARLLPPRLADQLAH